MALTVADLRAALEELDGDMPILIEPAGQALRGLAQAEEEGRPVLILDAGDD